MATSLAPTLVAQAIQKRTGHADSTNELGALERLTFYDLTLGLWRIVKSTPQKLASPQRLHLELAFDDHDFVCTIVRETLSRRAGLAGAIR
jgi:hypothetical protein